MRARFIGVSAALALAASVAFAPAAGAQGPLPTVSPTPAPGTATPTPTPAPTATPTPEEEQAAKDRKRKVVRRIYRDFEKDGRIEGCDHSVKALKIALRSISDEYEQDFPDFKDAVKAAIRSNKRTGCVEATPTPTPTASATPAPTSPAPVAPAPTSSPVPLPSSTPESGQIPGLGGTFDDGSGDKPSKPKSGKATPTPGPGEGAIPEGTPAPTATPAPTTAAPLPPKLVVTRASAEPNLFVPGTMLAIALFGLLFAALSALAARRSGRLAGLDQAWREAGFRASGAWAEFKDWLRLGR